MLQVNEFVNCYFFNTKKPFFLRHTACLPSSTSQLVLFHHLFYIHFWGGGGPLSCSLLGGPLLCSLLGGPLPCSLLGGPLLCSLPGGSTSIFTSGGSTSMFTSGGSHVTYPIMLLYTAIECPSASWANSHGSPPPPRS